MSNITQLKFGDEDGGGENTLLGFHIRVLSNGWLLSIEDDEEDVEEAYLDKFELLKRIGELL